MNKIAATTKVLLSEHTVFMVDWWTPGGRYPDGDIAVEEVKTCDGIPENWNRGDHYR
jgi:hypothetical protein